MKFPNFKNELSLLAQGYTYVSGCDEVGVAPLAGPVVAAACVIDPRSIGKLRSKNKWYYRVRDSKTTYEDERPNLAAEIKSHCVAFGIGEVAPETIDRINIHNASLLAMKIAVINMIEEIPSIDQPKIFLFLDGRFIIKDLELAGSLGFSKITQKAVIDGDVSVFSISSASIIAKVHRDNLLKLLDVKYPVYGFSRNKGYNTKQHREAILQNGITEFHRKSFLKNFNLQAQKENG